MKVEFRDGAEKKWMGQMKDGDIAMITGEYKHTQGTIIQRCNDKDGGCIWYAFGHPYGMYKSATREQLLADPRYGEQIRVLVSGDRVVIP